MSIIHFDAMPAAAAEGEFVELLNVFCNDQGVTFASARIRTLAAGQVKRRCGGSEVTAFNWIDPLSAAPGSPAYQVKRGVAVPDEASLIGPDAGVWTAVTSNPSWELICSTTSFGPIIVRDAVFTVSIRQGTGPVIDTAVWDIGIECTTLN